MKNMVNLQVAKEKAGGNKVIIRCGAVKRASARFSADTSLPLQTPDLFYRMAFSVHPPFYKKLCAACPGGNFIFLPFPKSFAVITVFPDLSACTVPPGVTAATSGTELLQLMVAGKPPTLKGKEFRCRVKVVD